MFQKLFALSAENKVSGKDKKKLRKSFQRLYPRITDEDLDAVLPWKSESLTVAKLKSPHRGVLYIEDGVPVVLDTTGKGDLVPTLVVLWQFPNLLPRITLKHFTVSKFILNGADLMLPGVTTPFNGGFLQGTLVSICIPGNPAPFAFGYASMSSTQAMQSNTNEGRLVQIVQSYSDLMTRHFSNIEPPNSGFTHTLISPIEEANDPETTTVSDDFSDEDEDEIPYEEPEIEQADMDQLLIECLFQALHKSVKNKDLPLAAGELWLKHMSPFSKVHGIAVDVRKSSYKKLSKFLQHFTSKDQQPLLTLKVDKFSNETIITNINRRHEDYLSFNPQIEQTHHVQNDKEEIFEGNKIHELKVEEVYRMGRELNQILSALSLEPGSVLSKKQAEDLAFDYVKHAKLDQGVPDAQHIVLDKVLGEALFKGRLKKNEKIPEYLPKSQLREISFTRMHPQFRISRGQQEVLKKGNIQSVHVVEEKRTGNKHITRISGLQGFLIDVQETSFELKKRFACSTSLNDAFHKGVKEKEIILQGRRSKEISQFIEKELKIPKQYIKSKM
eukprot:g1377.t1